MMRVFLFDEFKPETSAMLQALYSRSAESVQQHVKKVREKGSDQFMASYYVGYGHASIGDCGVTTLYVEDVSLLACKAIQDNPLYSGQETSTRYIDFSKQRVCDPVGSTRSEALQRRWIDFYCEISTSVIEHLKSRFPRSSGGKEKLWEKAIAARGFDVLRGFLPAGVTSQLAWTTNLRQAHEQLLRLESHPLSEVRTIAEECRRTLAGQYPNSFGHHISDSERDYLRRVAAMEAYVAPGAIRIAPGQFEVTTDIDNSRLEAEVSDLLQSRPRKAQLPKSLARYGHYWCRFALDFGSFRDLQRHRSGLCRMPLLTPDLGFHFWYLDQLPNEIRSRAESFVSQQLAELAQLNALSLTRDERQYYLPIGMNVACEIMYDLPQMVYVAELRSGQTVHPTLRWVAQQLGLALRDHHPKLALYADMSESDFCIRRGNHDIIERPTAA
jgi:thymidylate synthase ThyX